MRSHFLNIHFACINMLAVLLSVAALTFIVCAAENDAAVQSLEREEKPPVSIYDEEDAFISCADAIRISRINGASYLFLPSYVKADSLAYIYNGQLLMYDEATGTLVKRGAAFHPLLQDGKLHFYEYSQELSLYYHYVVDVMNGSEISVVSISLDDGDYAFFRVARTKSASAPGTIRITGADGNPLYYGRMPKFGSRGNTSFSPSNDASRKVSYNFNLSRDCELIEGSGAIKKWTMLGVRNSTMSKFDPTGLSHMMPFDLNDDLLADGNKYGIGHSYADLYVNGEYRGVYLLTERMNMNGAFELNDQDDYDGVPDNYGKSQSVRVRMDDDFSIRTRIQEYRYDPRTVISEDDDITGGYILEVQYDGYDGYGFMTARGLPISIKHPSNPSIEQVRYIAEYVQNFENAIFSPDGCNDYGVPYTEYLDLESAASQILLSGFFSNWELFRTSTYFSKEADGETMSKLVFGPTWDFESGVAAFTDPIMFSSFHFYNDPQQPLWIEQLWIKGEFLTVAHSIAGKISEYLHASLRGDPEDPGSFLKMADTVTASENMNWVRWDMDSSFEKQSTLMFAALRERLARWDDWWDCEQYLCGVTATAESTPESGMELVAHSVGEAYDTDMVWYALDSPGGVPTIAGYGTSLSLSPDAELTSSEENDPEQFRTVYYYAECSGPNNMYCSYALAGVSAMQTIPVTSNLLCVRFPKDSAGKEIAQESGSPLPEALSRGAFLFLIAFLIFMLIDLLILRYRKHRCPR